MSNKSTRNTYTFASVDIPACGPQAATVLIEARSGALTSGLCRTVDEAQARITALLAGEALATQAPEGQANRREMLMAWSFLNLNTPRGWSPLPAIETALDAGIHTVAWAVASRAIAPFASSFAGDGS